MIDNESVIPLVDLKAAHAEVADEVSVGFARVLTDAAFIKGHEVAAFEQEFAIFSEAAHCIGLANGTDAIELALRATGLAHGAEVIIPANTFVATAEAVIRAGGTPVFADVKEDTLLIDPVSASKAAGANTAAIVPVHLYGQIAPMRPLMDMAESCGLTVVEDAAQAQGARQDGLAIGSWGRAAATSFYPGKNLGAYGDAGAVLTGSAELAQRVRLLGDHGSERKYLHSELGFNSRMDALQAVVLRAKLRLLSTWNERRRQVAARYDELLADLADVRLPSVAAGNEHVWHLYVIRVPERDRVIARMNNKKVQAAIHYPVPLHLQPAFRSYGHAKGDFPAAEAAARELISLPIYPHITARQQDAVVAALKDGMAAAT